MNFKVGDRVICTGGSWYEDVKGIPGTVVTTEDISFDEVGIRFDEKVKYGNGHNLRGFLSEEDEPYGYYISMEDLKKYKKSNKERY